MHTELNKNIPYFSDDGMACSESTLRCLIERGVVDLPLSAVKMMTGLHGNMGRCANCGAINGGAAAIGSKYGRTQPDQDSKKVYRLVEAFMTEFENRFGSVKCLDLLNGQDPADLSVQMRCADQVVATVEIVTALIEKEENQNK